MLEKNVKIGDRVVPFQKTRQSHIINWTKFLDFGNDTSKFFRENGYLIVQKSLQGFFYLGNGNDKCDKFEFNASDFEPYKAPAKDSAIKHVFVHGGMTIVYLTGERKGRATCSPSDTFDPVKGLALAYMRALGQAVDDIRIEINPAQSAPQEDKPLTFEVGEMVRIIESQKDDFHIRHGEIISQIGKIHTIKSVTADPTRPYIHFENNTWAWPFDMLEKVPQPANLEVFIGGVKYVKEELK